MGRVLSICCGMGLLDRAFLDVGFDVWPGCENHEPTRKLYAQVCGQEPHFHNLENMMWHFADDPRWITELSFDGIIGGPPCQSRSRIRFSTKREYQDLSSLVVELVCKYKPEWFVFENVAKIPIPNAKHVFLNAMHFYKPHQSRGRWFTHSPNLIPPGGKYKGTADSLLAYPCVHGWLYSEHRAALLQGFPAAVKLSGDWKIRQKALSNAVPYPLALEWARAVKKSLTKGG